MVTIIYHVRPYPSQPGTSTFATQAPPHRQARVLAQYAEHVRRQFGASTTRETAWRRLDDGSYEVWKRQRPGGLLLATITLTP
jgi:hypothetical protein